MNNIYNLDYTKLLDEIDTYDIFQFYLKDILRVGAWKKTLEKDTIEAYEKYLYNFPNTSNKNEIIRKIKIESFRQNTKIDIGINNSTLFIYDNRDCNRQPIKLPDFIFNFTEVTKLEINCTFEKNSLDLIDRLINLVEISIQETFIEELPSNIYNLKNLEKLILRANCLKKIPLGISNLSNLRELDISDNQLEYIPEDIGNLKNLIKLNISGHPRGKSNTFTKLPESINKLTKLRFLDLRWNYKLKNIPNLSTLVNLKKIMVDDWVKEAKND